jgi:ligand-binding SRPBCC domain-containing protein
MRAGTHRLEWSQVIPRQREEVFGFFAEAGNLEKLTPAFLHFRILTPLPIHITQGTLIDYRLRLFGIPFRWQTRIETFDPPKCFSDTQIVGPYRHWHHLHEFYEIPGGTRVVDRVVYELPLGPCGVLTHTLVVRRLLDRIFAYRGARLRALFPPGDTIPMPHHDGAERAL